MTFLVHLLHALNGFSCWLLRQAIPLFFRFFFPIFLHFSCKGTWSSIPHTVIKDTLWPNFWYFAWSLWYFIWDGLAYWFFLKIVSSVGIRWSWSYRMIGLTRSPGSIGKLWLIKIIVFDDRNILFFQISPIPPRVFQINSACFWIPILLFVFLLWNFSLCLCVFWLFFVL